MNYTLQLHGERVFYQVPPGLYELMSDISREVLRDKPDQIYKYISHYMDTLLKLRTNTTKAAELVDDVIADNRELFAYVDSLGITWEEVSGHARVIQNAWRGYRAKQELREKVRAEKEKKLRNELFVDHSPSFIAYFESLGIDYNTANTACATIQGAVRTYLIRKQTKSMDSSSTHTIDVIKPDLAIPLVLDRSSSRDSKLLVYQQSPSPSINSAWYKPIPVPVMVDPSKKSVISSTSAKSHGTSILERTSTKGVDEVRLSATLKTPLPKYFDAEQSKVPMISKSGQLDVLEEDVVTLFSTDTFDVSESFVGAKQLPSLKELGSKPSKTESETEKELFSIIENKSSKGDRPLKIISKDSKSKDMMDFSRSSLVSRSQKSANENDIRRPSETSRRRMSQTSQSKKFSNTPSKSSKSEKLMVKISEEFEPNPEQ